MSELLVVIRYMRVPIAAISIIGNLFVLIIILRYRALRQSSSNILIAQLSFADFFSGNSILIRFVYDVISIANNRTLHNRADCLIIGSFVILGVHLIQTTIPMVAIDRLFCLLCPLAYRRLNDRPAFSIFRFLLSTIFSLISTSVQFIGFPPSGSTSVCSAGSSWDRYYRFYFTVFSCSSAFLTCATFIFTVLVYCRQRLRTKTNTRNSVLITTTAILTSYVIFWCIPIGVFLCGIIFAFNREIQDRIVFFLSLGGGIFASLNPFLFLWKHSSLRGYFFQSIGYTKSIQRQHQIVVRTIPIGDVKNSK